MTEIRLDRDLLSKALLVTAALALLVGLAVFLRPNKPTSLTAEEKLEQIGKLKREIEAEGASLDFHRKHVAAFTWSQKQEDIGPLALAGVSKRARNHGLRLLTFRPQKAEQEKDLVRFPFTLSVEGRYLDVVAFAKDLEKSESKLVLNMIQLNSSDGITDRVNASVNVIAFSTDLPLGGKHD